MTNFSVRRLHESKDRECFTIIVAPTRRGPLAGNEPRTGVRSEFAIHLKSIGADAARPLPPLPLSLNPGAVPCPDTPGEYRAN